jgi:hypothetical protein
MPSMRRVHRFVILVLIGASRPEHAVAQRLTAGLSVGGLVPRSHYLLTHYPVISTGQGIETGFAMQGRVAVQIQSRLAIEAIGVRASTENRVYLPAAWGGNGRSEGTSVRVALRLEYQPFRRASTTPTLSIGPIWARTRFAGWGAPGVRYSISAYGLGVGAGFRQTVNPDVELRLAADDYIFRYSGSQSFFKPLGGERPMQHDIVATLGLAVRIKH